MVLDVCRWLGSEFYNENNFESAAKYFGLMTKNMEPAKVDKGIWLNYAKSLNVLKNYPDAVAAVNHYLETATDPAERAQVREALPEVAVPELPADPAFYAETLLAAGYFEAIGFTAEDRQRAEQYRANAVRSELLGGATDLASYLQSLGMRAICGPFDSVGRARITQLINKSNQFNLTTRRYTEADVQAFFAERPIKGGEKALAQNLEQLRLSVQFNQNQAQPLAAMFSVASSSQG